MKRVLVTGAGGFIGHHLTTYLEAVCKLRMALTDGFPLSRDCRKIGRNFVMPAQER